MSGEIDTSQVLDNLLPDLHADSYANLTYWTESELYRFLDQGAKQLANAAMMFVERDASQSTQPGVSGYPLPARYVATVHVSYGDRPLRPATIIEMEARDPAFLSTEGAPDHWFQDDLALGIIGLAPVPDQAAALPMLSSVTPPDLDLGSTLLQAPAPVAIYLGYFVLAKCYGLEGESEQSDLAQHCAAKVQLLEQVFAKYYGEAG